MGNRCVVLLAAHVACPAPAQPKMWPALASSLARASHHPTSPHTSYSDMMAILAWQTIFIAYKNPIHVDC